MASPVIEETAPEHGPGERLRSQWRPTLVLAWPVIIAELGWMAMTIVDTMMVGGLGPEAIGAVSVGGMLHFAIVIFGMGILLGLDTLVSQAFGAGRLDEGRRSLVQGLYLSAIVAPPLILLQFAAADRLVGWGITTEVARISLPSPISSVPSATSHSITPWWTNHTSLRAWA